MCFKCDGFNTTIKFELPYQYFNIFDQVKMILAEGTFVLIKGNCILSQIQKDKPWPEDYIYHIFKCNECNRKFELAIETYHGSGGHWKTLID